MADQNEMLKIVTPMMEHVCDHLCRFPREISDQEELDKVCGGCQMGSKNIYSVYDNGTKVGEYTSKEATKLLDIPRSSIINCAYSCLVYKGRYTFDVVGRAKKEDLLAKEWDRVRKKILASGR